MKPIHQHRLATLARKLLEASGGGGTLKAGRKKLRFDMTGWAEDKDENQLDPREVNHCGTSCCFLGYAPLVMKETRKMTDWDDVAEWVVGEDPEWKIGWFLFDASWPSVPREAAVRALYVLLHHDDPDVLAIPSNDMNDERLEPLMKLTECQIYDQLKTFLQPELPSK